MQAFEAADRPRYARQHRRLGHRDHRRARPRALATGKPIVYTSADSVFQIAAHEEVIPVPELYRYLRDRLRAGGVGLGVGRVIARPFVGVPGAFTRTANRRDFALTPFAPTLLDRMKDAGKTSYAIGKIEDLFAGRGDHARRAHDERRPRDGRSRGCAVDRRRPGSIFANLVDFDTQYGHRNDPAGYAANLERFDARLATFLPRLTTVRPADRHRRSWERSHDAEHRSFARARPGVRRWRCRCARNVDLGVRSTFADLGQTLADLFDVGPLAHGRSFLDEILT